MPARGALAQAVDATTEADLPIAVGELTAVTNSVDQTASAMNRWC